MRSMVGRPRLAQEFSPEGSLAPSAAEAWKEYFIYGADFAGGSVLPAGIANGLPPQLPFSDFVIRLDADSNFEWIRTMYQATDPRIYVRYRDNVTGRFLHEGTLDLRGVAGYFNSGPSIGAEAPAFMPFNWPHPHILASSSTFTLSCADFSGAPNTVRISLHGNKIRAGRSPWKYRSDGSERKIRQRLPYVLPVPADATNYTIGANQTIPFSASLGGEADLLITAITGVRTGAALVQLQDGAGHGRLWMDRAVYIDNLIGNGLKPNILPSPRYIVRGSTINGVITDLSGAPNTVRLYLIGFKLYEA